jgi:hypothetical protein
VNAAYWCHGSRADDRDKNMNKNVLRVVPACAAVFLVACGGGDNAPTNTPPTVPPQSFNGNENATLSGQISATDAGDTLTFAVTTSPMSGALTAFSTGGAFTYRPNAFFVGTDTFSVSVTDSARNTVVANVSITLAAVNDPPVANDDVLTVTSAAGIDVTANDTDPDGDQLTVSIVGTSFPAGATVGADQRVSFPQGAAFKGMVRFQYRVTDGGLTDEATAVAFVNVPPMKAVFVGAPATAQATEDRVFMHDLLSARRADGNGAAKIVSVDVAGNGRVLVYQQQFAAGGAGFRYELFFVDLAQPDQRQPVTGRLDDGVVASRVVLSNDGRFVVFQLDRPNAAGSAIYRFDSQAPAALAQRISPPDGELQFAVAPRLNAAGTVVYYGGRESSTGRAYVYRSSLSTGAAEIIARGGDGSNGVRDVGFDFVWPTPDESSFIFHGLQSRFPPDPNDVVLVGNPLTPNFAQLIHQPAPAAASFKIPLISPDGLNVVMFGNRALSLGRSDAPMNETMIGPDFNFAWKFLDTIPDRERVMRADSKAALLVVGCGWPAMFPTVSCDVHELTFTDPAAPVRVNATNATGNHATDPAYSADGARIVFLDQESTAKSLAVVNRGSFGTQNSVSAAGQDVVRYQLDASGYVVLYATQTAGTSDQKLFIANVDAPGEALELGLASAGAPFQLVAR